MARIGIFGGSFDPVHTGHLILAELCRESGQLDEIRFVPASTPPHKISQGRASEEHRQQMLQLAIGGHRSFSICDIELQRGGISYTVDTLRQLQEASPNDELFLMMGADSLYDIPTWRNPEEICQLATLLVANRPGSHADDSKNEVPVDFGGLQGIASPERIQQFAQSVVDIPQLDISSSEIRSRIGSGKSIRYQTPRAVEQYIRTAGIYC